MIDVRRITAAEWPLYRQVRLAALAEAPHAFSKPLARAEAFTDEDWRRLASEGAEGGPNGAVLAHGLAGPVGMACGIADAEHDDRSYLVAMWVAPDHRGGDLAVRILTAVEDWATAQGARVVLAGVTGCNARALAFYRKQGYVDHPAGDSRHPATAGCEVVLVKSLRS